MIKINRPHGRLTIPTTHACAEIGNQTTLLFKVCQFFLVLAANIVTWLGVVSCDKIHRVPFHKRYTNKCSWCGDNCLSLCNLVRCMYVYTCMCVMYDPFLTLTCTPLTCRCTCPLKGANYSLTASGKLWCVALSYSCGVAFALPFSFLRVIKHSTILNQMHTPKISSPFRW